MLMGHGSHIVTCPCHALHCAVQVNLYKSAKLVPRVSDTDFADGDMEDVEAEFESLKQVAEKQTPEELAAAARKEEFDRLSDEVAKPELSSSAKAVADYLERNKVSVSVIS